MSFLYKVRASISSATLLVVGYGLFFLPIFPYREFMALALVAIARDEEHCIARMLRSVAGCVEDVVVVDTGSTDATAQVALDLGARVFTYQWDHSFANARNYALSQARSPWALILDADECLVDGHEALLKAVARPPNFVGRLIISSSFRDPSRPDEPLFSDEKISRLLPSYVRYAGIVHEQPVHNLPLIDLPIRITHDGYEPANLARKGSRNLVLLERALDNPNRNPYLEFQYARELRRAGRFIEAEKVMGKLFQSTSAKTAPWWEDAVCLSLELYGETENFSAGLTIIEKLAEQFENSVDFWFCVGIFSFRIAEKLPSLRREALARMETSFQYCLQLGDQGFKSRLVLGREGPLARQNLGAYAGVKPDASAGIDQ